MEKTNKQFIRFYLNDEACGLSIDLVYKIIPYGNITDVPFSPDFIMGITNLRGEILAVLDIKKFLGISSEESDDYSLKKDKSIIITNYLGKLIGLFVDKVLGVITFENEEIKLPPKTITSKLGNYVNGVGGTGESFTVLVDFESIINSTQFEQFA